MADYFINLDITGFFKQSDIILISSPSPDNLYYRLYKDKYEIDYSTMEELRLIFDDDASGNVYTLASSTVEAVNGTKVVKIEIPVSMKNGKYNYVVRPVFRTGGVNKALPKFKAFTRLETSPDLEALKIMIQRVNSIYSIYLDSIKRQEIGAPLGVVPLDDKARIPEQYIPQDIVDHVHAMYKEHGLRLNADYFIEYWDMDDKRWYLLNLLEGGKFEIPHKPNPEFSYDGGLFNK